MLSTRADYSAMREMFFGDSVPSFDEVLLASYPIVFSLFMHL